MKNRLYCNLAPKARATKHCLPLLLLVGAVALLSATPALAGGDAPQWMHALVNAPLPAHDDKTDAVLLYSEENINVISTDKIKRVVRQAYKILRPSGRDQGTVVVYLG